MVVGARQASLSISETAGLQGLSTHNHLEALQRMLQKKKSKKSNCSCVDKKSQGPDFFQDQR